MNFNQWCEQISKEIDGNVPIEFVRGVMITAIRVALEEFRINPAQADLDIGSVGRFYMNHRLCHFNHKFETMNTIQKEEYMSGGDENMVRWSMHFKTSLTLKKIINGYKDMNDFTIGGGFPLYPDEYFKTHSKKKKKQVKYKFYVSTTEKGRNRHTDEYWYKQIDKAIEENTLKQLKEEIKEGKKKEKLRLPYQDRPQKDVNKIREIVVRSMKYGVPFLEDEHWKNFVPPKPPKEYIYKLRAKEEVAYEKRYKEILNELHPYNRRGRPPKFMWEEWEKAKAKAREMVDEEVRLKAEEIAKQEKEEKTKERAEIEKNNFKRMTLEQADKEQAKKEKGKSSKLRAEQYMQMMENGDYGYRKIRGESKTNKRRKKRKSNRTSKRTSDKQVDNQ